ncbi:ABC transporter ATP-binding protein [Bradyrhizobium sp. Arg237L]|uniref:ABC transporter ATP-binding protein n=1 Tax=Bradyrhizobium sp. Arg237L TaxID=3003352 RepID=UPI00249E1664|nr:ABC transporter ATP-binding protein [Bradyrhizobium sp. Arg237L]MDI4238306.1 ABC transporter ATP-binding protein [Bradyrhizobium sp. Arg237L]
MAVLSVSSLRVGYGSDLVVQAVDLDIRRGEIVCVLGRNGVGKTTMVNAIMGLLPSMSGSIHLGASDLTSVPPYRRSTAGLALVPQGRRLFKELSVRQNLEVAARSPRKDGHGWTVTEVFDRFPSLARRADIVAAALSGGEQQMLSLSRAMVTWPKVLLLDEPSEGLAPIIIEQIAQLLGELRRSGASILLIEQNVGFGLSVADRVYIMSKGAIVASGTSAELEAEGTRLERFLGVGH